MSFNCSVHAGDCAELSSMHVAPSSLLSFAIRHAELCFKSLKQYKLTARSAHLHNAGQAIGSPPIDDALRGVHVVAERAAASVDGVEDGGGNLDQALPVRDQRV